MCKLKAQKIEQFLLTKVSFDLGKNEGHIW